MFFLDIPQFQFCKFSAITRVAAGDRRQIYVFGRLVSFVPRPPRGIGA